MLKKSHGTVPVMEPVMKSRTLLDSYRPGTVDLVPLNLGVVLPDLLPHHHVAHLQVKLIKNSQNGFLLIEKDAKESSLTLKANKMHIF
jgi:hypothetical protein